MDDLDELALVDGLLCDAKNVERQRHQAGDSDICPFCANFDFSEVLSPPHSQEHLGWPEPTLEDVKISASSGCPSCDVLCKVVEDFGLEMSLSQAVGKMSLASEPQVRIKHSYTDQGDPNGFLSLGLVAEVIRKKRRNKKPRYVASKLIDISQLPRNHWTLPPPSPRGIHFELCDPYCLQFVAKSLWECLEHHEVATKLLPELPRRVIEITSATSVRLVQTEGQRSHYTTLSHRWSDEIETAPNKTNRDNLRDRLSAISIHDLSPLFRDAIRTTSILGIEYVWIDSLCIIQDDKDDWVSESANMNTIYGQSTLTMFATSTNGLFPHREDHKRESYCYNTRWGETVDLLAQLPLAHSFLCDDSLTKFDEYKTTKVEPCRRGWVFQEWLLSQRAIVFGSDELLWCCDHTVHCECVLWDWHPRRHLEQNSREYESFNLLAPRCMFRLIKQGCGSDDSAVGNLSWLRMARVFSQTRLTVETDRLPALSGVAKQWYKSRNARMDESALLKNYLAGCWRDDLMPSLLWFSQPPTWSLPLQQRAEITDMRKWAYIAPSWSWLSLSNFVEFALSSQSYTGNYRTDVAPSSLVHRKVARIEEALCLRATRDSTGALERGLLTVSGPVFEAQLIPSQDPEWRSELRTDAWTKLVWADHGSRPYYSVLMTQEPVVEVTCLLLVSALRLQTRASGRRFFYHEIGLILIPAREQAHCFERVGLFDIEFPVVGPASTEQQWRTSFGIEGFDAAQEVEFGFFFERLRRQEVDLPVSREAFLPNTTCRRVTIV